MNKIVLVFGTRPELIKLAPIIYEFKRIGLQGKLIVVNTNQHNSLVKSHLELFNIIPDYTTCYRRTAQKACYSATILGGVRKSVFNS